MASLAESVSDVRPTTGADAPGWQAELADAIRDPVELCRLLGLDAELGRRNHEAGFATLVPRPFLKRIRFGDPTDPLLRQVLPAPEETQGAEAPTDVVGDLAAEVIPGLIQKYHGRALLMASPHCAVHCRYCFRRHFPYENVAEIDATWSSGIEAIRKDATLSELILSGGDPLTVSDRRLSRLLDWIDGIGHLRRVRLHTRLPVVLPSRVTGDLLSLLCGRNATIVIVVHVNHAREIDEEVADAFGRLRECGALLLNQSVLLRGVNDGVETLAELSERLVSVGVTPYYLHQLDRVAGVSHFEVPETTARRLIEDLSRRLPGYAVPRLVREEAGAASKTFLA